MFEGPAFLQKVPVGLRRSESDGSHPDGEFQDKLFEGPAFLQKIPVGLRRSESDGSHPDGEFQDKLFEKTPSRKNSPSDCAVQVPAALLLTGSFNPLHIGSAAENQISNTCSIIFSNSSTGTGLE